MLRDLITLPLRIGACAARLALHVTEDAVGAVLRGTERHGNADVSRGRTSPANAPDAADGVELEVVLMSREAIAATPTWAAEAEAPAGSAPAAPAEAPAPPAEAPAPPARATAPDSTSAEPDGGWVSPEAAPRHVSEEPELVEAFAEPGAEEGAGATVHIDEPWHGYGQMTASEIIARLGDASREELAEITLYEAAHRNRRTIVAAAKQKLQRASAVSSARAR